MHAVVFGLWMPTGTSRGEPQRRPRRTGSDGLFGEARRGGTTAA